MMSTIIQVSTEILIELQSFNATETTKSIRTIDDESVMELQMLVYIADLKAVFHPYKSMIYCTKQNLTTNYDHKTTHNRNNWNKYT